MDWEEDELLYDYNPTKVMVAKKAKVVKLTPK